MKRISAVVLAILAAMWGASAQIFCWNLENYFDSYDDPSTADEAFTPRGEYRWTRRKWEAKRNLIAKTIIASSERFAGELPALVGLCEVENRFVLKSLVEDTPLAKIRYRTVHRESPDPRGIDVALLYDPARVKLLDHGWITISEFATREVLYAKVSMPDTIHIYVNHWPSKYSGARESEHKRQAVCDALAAHLDSLQTAAPGAKIIVMGDFNDIPESPSVGSLCSRAGLVNLSPGKGGTIKFKGSWEMIDQMLASPSAAAIIASPEVYRPDFLLEEDKAFLGVKPRRTNIGPRYNGGASDHLPIIANILP